MPITTDRISVEGNAIGRVRHWRCVRSGLCDAGVSVTDLVESVDNRLFKDVNTNPTCTCTCMSTDWKTVSLKCPYPHQNVVSIVETSASNISPVCSWSNSQLGPPPHAEVTGSRSQLLGSCRNACEHSVWHLVWIVSGCDHVRHIQSHWERKTGSDRFFPCELIIYTFQLSHRAVVWFQVSLNPKYLVAHCSWLCSNCQPTL